MGKERQKNKREEKTDNRSIGEHYLDALVNHLQTSLRIRLNFFNE